MEFSSEPPAEDRSSPAHGCKAVILVVDDEPDMLAAFQLFLSIQGDLEVVTAASAKEALRHIESRLPDLIITDYLMPRTSGLELCRALRTRDDTCRIPIIVHSASALPENVRELYDRVVPKPAALDVMLATVRALLQPVPAGRAIGQTDNDAADVLIADLGKPGNTPRI